MLIQVSFRTFRYLLFPKQVSWLGLFCCFLQQDGSSKYIIFYHTFGSFSNQSKKLTKCCRGYFWHDTNSKTWLFKDLKPRWYQICNCYSMFRPLKHSVYIRTVSSQLYSSFGTFDSFLASSAQTTHKAVKQVQQSRKQLLRAYCPKIYTVPQRIGVFSTDPFQMLPSVSKGLFESSEIQYFEVSTLNCDEIGCRN